MLMKFSLMDYTCIQIIKQCMCIYDISNLIVSVKGCFRRPVGVPLDLSTPKGMSCIGTYGENCKSDNLSKYRVLLVVFLLVWHEN